MRRVRLAMRKMGKITKSNSARINQMKILKKADNVLLVCNLIPMGEGVYLIGKL